MPARKPDMVVVDIDETDFLDDAATYRQLTLRDEEGKIVRVLPSPVYSAKVRKMVSLKSRPFYLQRLLEMWWHNGIYLYFFHKAYKKKYKAKYYAHPLAEQSSRFSMSLVPAFDEAHDAEKKYAEETRHFKQTVTELIDTLTNLLGNAKRVVFIYHPHPHHLMPDARGLYWKSYVKPVVQSLAAEKGVLFYDSTGDLKRGFGKFPQDFYFPNDMHLNNEGLRVYSREVARKIVPVVLENMALPEIFPNRT